MSISNSTADSVVSNRATEMRALLPPSWTYIGLELHPLACLWLMYSPKKKNETKPKTLHQQQTSKQKSLHSCFGLQRLLFPRRMSMSDQEQPCCGSFGPPRMKKLLDSRKQCTFGRFPPGFPHNLEGCHCLGCWESSKVFPSSSCQAFRVGRTEREEFAFI